MIDLPGPVLTRQHSRWAVAHHGAQVLAWQPVPAISAGAPAASSSQLAWTDRPVLWFDPTDPQELPGVIRGGIPVCAPWFGHGPADDRNPQHGAMRLIDFTREILADSANRLRVRYRGSLPGVDVVQMVEMTDSALRLGLTLTSTLGHPQQVEAVWHSYLRVGDASRTTVRGVAGADLHNYATGQRGPLADDILPVRPDTDTVLQDPAGPLVLVDPAWRRRITLRTAGCPTAVVWNPLLSQDTRSDLTGTAWRDFVCVETGAAKEHAIELPAGRSTTLQLEIGVHPDPRS
ncbi:D-hexose-6-phosphate mutarotase [Acidipropionibacterium jensenii]|uniref:aldose epimerase family protein n=1 Tax=Acidipropionibacterium jensenii TaxID=1749 RepID=UPI000A013754|nr:D-hexose-6-phosphate mutarotase [Acidipropionibacterium jensenii]